MSQPVPGSSGHRIRVPGPPIAHHPALVEAWRRQRLLEAGFDAELAAELASEPALDLHQLLPLIDRGCPPELAARIAAPVTNRAR